MGREVGPLPARTQVLVAGGGPVGLAAAVELARRGVDCVVVEPRTQVSHARPRCKTVNVRTMEHLRRWGVADRLRERCPLPVAWSQDVVFCTSLTGRELARFTGVLGLAPDGDRFPELGQQAPQYVLEELLRDLVAESASARLCLGSRVVDVAQDDEGVRVTVEDAGGARAVVAADYVLGCDGPRSTVRARVGAAYVGGLALRPNFGMLFHAPDLAAQVRHGPAVHYWTVNAGAPALMGPLDLDGTWWIITIGVDRETRLREAGRIVDAAAGRPVGATVLSHDPWTARMQLVDRLRVGRVFLAGDAAHLNPPFGGHGMNTGFGDAVDLGWKLAATLAGWAGPGLLDSYEAERRPVQDRVIRSATENMRTLSTELYDPDLEAAGPAGVRARAAAAERITATKHVEFHALDLVLAGLPRRGPVLVPDLGSGAGGPGERLPHAWLADGRSLYDVLGPDLTLLVLDGVPRTPFEDAARARSVPLATVDLREERLVGRLGARAVLVRPDQHIGWRGDHTRARAGRVLDRVRGS